MKRVGFLLKVSPDKVQKYKDLHDAVWPEMIDALHRNGWRNYSLFLRRDGLLFGCFETPNGLKAAIEAMNKEKVNQAWQEFVASCFEGLNGDRPDESMEELQEVFHID